MVACVQLQFAARMCCDGCAGGKKKVEVELSSSDARLQVENQHDVWCLRLRISTLDESENGAKYGKFDLMVDRILNIQKSPRVERESSGLNGRKLR